MKQQPAWKILLGIAPMPMLALVASYGVYEFGLLFMPWYFALIGATAFETVYLGLAVQRLRSDEARNRARNISRGAVAVSILYVAVAAYVKRNPGVLAGMPWYGEVALALLHSTPLATLNYLVAQLLLHEDEHEDAVQPLAQLELAPESRNVAQLAPRVVAVLRPSPPSMRRRQLPAPVAAAMIQPVADVAQVDEWIRRNDAKESYAAISRSLGGQPSRQHISAQCIARRAQLAQPAT